jgi:hypothetical protein
VSTRLARCSCGATQTSSPRLAFFQTAEAFVAGRCGVCGYHEVAHAPDVRSMPHMRRGMDDGHEFVQRDAADHDVFYCGCQGWD